MPPVTHAAATSARRTTKPPAIRTATLQATPTPMTLNPPPAAPALTGAETPRRASLMMPPATQKETATAAPPVRSAPPPRAAHGPQRRARRDAQHGPRQRPPLLPRTPSSHRRRWRTAIARVGTAGKAARDDARVNNDGSAPAGTVLHGDRGDTQRHVHSARPTKVPRRTSASPPPAATPTSVPLPASAPRRAMERPTQGRHQQQRRHARRGPGRPTRSQVGGDTPRPASAQTRTATRTPADNAPGDAHARVIGDAPLRAR